MLVNPPLKAGNFALQPWRAGERVAKEAQREPVVLPFTMWKAYRDSARGYQG